MESGSKQKNKIGVSSHPVSELEKVTPYAEFVQALTNLFNDRYLPAELKDLIAKEIIHSRIKP